MKPIKYSQFGTLLVVLIAPLLVMFTIQSLFFHPSASGLSLTFTSLALLMAVLILNFYKLDIIIDETHLTFKMGIGLIRKKYLLSTIVGCRAVTNMFILGWGIRFLTNGMLYNVSGFKAIELSFNNKSSIVRIGTDQPDAVIAELSKRISIDQSNIQESTKRKDNSLKYKILLIVSVVVIILSFSIYSSLDARVTFNSSTLKIGGIYGCELPYTQIAEIDTVAHLPNVEYKSNGYGLFNVRKRYFVLTNFGEAVLYTNSSSTPIIQMRLKNGQYYFLNQSEKSKTIEIFETLKSKIKTNI